MSGPNLCRRTIVAGIACVSLLAAVVLLAAPSAWPQGMMVPGTGHQLQPRAAQSCSTSAELYSISPSALTQGQMNLSLELLGLELEKPDVTLDFGTGIVPVGKPVFVAMVQRQKKYRLAVNVMPGAPAGPHQVRLGFCGRTRETAVRIMVNAPQGGIGTLGVTVPQAAGQLPNIVAVVPNQWEPGKSYSLVLTGANFVQGMEVQFGADVTNKTALSILSANAAKLDVAVDPKAGGTRKAQLRTAQTQPWKETNASVFIKGALRAIAPKEPLCIPFSLRFEQGIISQQTPKWGHTNAGKEFDRYVGAPLLDDSVVFQWKEQNPGTAEYYEFRILDLDGNLLKMVRLDGQEVSLFGKKFTMSPPGVFHPDAAFVQEIIGLAPKKGPLQLVNPASEKAQLNPNLAPQAAGGAGGGVKMAAKAQTGAKQTESPKYPPESALLWEVVGYRGYTPPTCGVAEHPRTGPAGSAPLMAKTPGDTGKSSPLSKASQPLQVQQVQAPQMIKKDDKVYVGVERSDRWPLSIPDAANGISACDGAGMAKVALNVEAITEMCARDETGACKTQKVKKKVESTLPGGRTMVSWKEEEEKVIDPNFYPGYVLQVKGSFSIPRSPYKLQEEPKPAGSGFPNPNQGYAVYQNFIVDWGDGEPGSVVHPVTLDIATQGMKQGAYGNDIKVTYTLNPLEHQYQRVGRYYIRVYILSDDDMQKVNVDTLAQSVDKSSKNPYMRLASLSGGLRGLGGRSGGSSSAPAVAGRAYVLFCKAVDIRPFEDPAATGPLHLDAIAVTGFPGHDAGEGGCEALKSGSSRISARDAAKAGAGLTGRKSSADARKTLSSSLKASARKAAPKKRLVLGAVEPDATATDCDESLIAEGSLDYYGTGTARFTWSRDGTTVRVAEHEVPPSAQRENLKPTEPDKWPAPITSTDLNIPNSDNLMADQSGKSKGNHKVKVNAMVVFDAKAPEFGKMLEASLDNTNVRQGVSAALKAGGAKAKPMRAGFISPSKKASSGMPAVMYADGLMASESSVLPALKKPLFVESEPAAYLVKGGDPNQPCTFIFSDSDGGEFRISGLQGNVAQQGSTYRGCGNLLLKLNKSSDAAPEKYVVPIEFENWSVPDGSHVAKGAKLSAEPGKTISAPGVTGTLDKVEGTAGDKVNATLSLKLSDVLRAAGGSEKPPEWNNKASRVTAEGDWYLDGQKLPETFIGWSGFKIKSDSVAIDLSRTKSAGPVSPLCGGGGNSWVGVHLGNATLIPYLLDLVPVGGWPLPAVNDWAVEDEGVCGSANIAKPFDAKISEGTVHFDSISATADNGVFDATYKNMIVHVPWLDADLNGDAKLHYEGGGEKGIVFPLSGSASPKQYDTIRMEAKNLSFTQEQGIGWAVKAGDTKFAFTAEGKPFSTFNVQDLFFDMDDGRPYYAKGATSGNVSLSGMSQLGPTALDMISVGLDTAKGGQEYVKFTFDAKVHLSKKMPAADAQVLYSINRPGSSWLSTGPKTGPFSVAVAFPPGQPTVEANVEPNYTGPAGGSAAASPAVYAGTAEDGTSYLSDVQSSRWLWVPGDSYASLVPGGTDYAGLLGSGDGDRFNGALDLSMFGGPPIKAEFRLGYKGGDDYWLMRATIGLGASGVTLTPYLSLYAIRGGLGYNFPINAFSSVQGLNAAEPDMSGDYMFMAGMRVGAPSKFPYMLDGDFTVKLGTGARMDFRAWLMSPDQSGEGTFHGYFQYAGGCFDGMLAGKLQLLGDVAYVEVPENAATMHFGGGTWLISAGKKEGPRLKAHLLIQDVDGYFAIGNEGLTLGGGMHYKLNAGIGYIVGAVDGGLDVTPEPHITGQLNGSFAAKICAYDVCIGPSLTAGVKMSATPVSVGAHACFEIPIPFWDPEVCGDFSL